MGIEIKARLATEKDLEAILSIYNEGIEDRIATLETDQKDFHYMKQWFEQHRQRYSVIVAMVNEKVVGWSSLNPYSARRAYDGVADLSIYILREYRGRGVGSRLLKEIESVAVQNNFHKIVLFTFPFNELGQSLYKKSGYREVGVFKNQGKLNDKFVDVMIMEKLLHK
ncbi:arsinothricin resistance N-acetyltransferase ArsN1 family A [Ferdinandcohnia sp. Marseille-Q9671]